MDSFFSGICVDQVLSNEGRPTLNAYKRFRLLWWLPHFCFNWRKRDCLVIGLGLVEKLRAVGTVDTFNIILTGRDFRRLKYIPKNSGLVACLGFYGRFYRLFVSNKGSGSICSKIDYILGQSGAKVLIVNNTISPFNIAFAFRAKFFGIKVIVVQHGIYSEFVVREKIDRCCFDRFFFLNSRQQNILTPLFIKNGCLGEFYNLGRNVELWFMTQKKWCDIKIGFVGVDIEKQSYVGEKLMILNHYSSLAMAIESRFPGVRFVYRCHPSEIDKGQRFFDTEEHGSAKCDFYIGVFSTFLLDCLEIGIPSVQILLKGIVVDEFGLEQFTSRLENVGGGISVTNQLMVLDLLAEWYESGLRIGFESPDFSRLNLRCLVRGNY